jgi:hypothetical protein
MRIRDLCGVICRFSICLTKVILHVGVVLIGLVQIAGALSLTGLAGRFQISRAQGWGQIKSGYRIRLHSLSYLIIFCFICSWWLLSLVVLMTVWKF